MYGATARLTVRIILVTSGGLGSETRSRLPFSLMRKVGMTIITLYPNVAKAGLKWWEIDITWWAIQILSLLGLARKLVLPGTFGISKSRLTNT